MMITKTARLVTKRAIQIIIIYQGIFLLSRNNKRVFTNLIMLQVIIKNNIMRIRRDKVYKLYKNTNNN